MPTCERGFNLFDLLARAGTEHANQPFIFQGDRSLTYADTLTLVNRLAAGMTAQGLKAGDRVIMALENGLEIPLILFAAARIGVIFSIVSPQLKPDGFQRIARQCEPSLVFLEKVTAEVREQIPGVPAIWIGGVPPGTPGVNFDFANLPIDQAKAPEVVAGGERAAFLVFTSGSTGMPRGVTLSHANVHFVTGAIQARLGYAHSDRIAILLPLSFDYGLYQIFYAALCGASVLIGRPEMSGPELPRVLARHEITVLPGVPTLFAGLIKMQRYRPAILPSLRMFTNTGDHLPTAYVQQLTELFPGVQCFPMYGLTECKRVSILRPEEIATRPESVGRPLDGTEVWTEDSAGHRLPPGQAGEFVVSGPHVSLGYWNAPEETARRFRFLPEGGRELLTGDYGVVDEDGFLYFHARSDFMIKHRGHRLSPVEVEEAVCQLPLIVAAGCIKDEKRNLLCLFLTTMMEEPDAASILADLATRIERGKLPDKLIFVTELPRTPNQKVDRKVLRSLLETSS